MGIHEPDKGLQRRGREPFEAIEVHCGAGRFSMHVGMRAVVLAAALPAIAMAQTRPSDVTMSPTSSVRIERLATLEFPWGMAALPDGRLLGTEKAGRLRIFADGKTAACLPPTRPRPPLRHWFSARPYPVPTTQSCAPRAACSDADGD